MGRVSQAVKDLRQLSLPEDAEIALSEPRFWTTACFREYLKLCDDLIFEDPLRGLAAARVALRFARRLSPNAAVDRFEALAVLGSAHRVLGDLSEATKAYDEALRISREAALAESEMTRFFCRLAILRLVQNRGEEALELATRAVDVERLYQEPKRGDALSAALVIRGIILSQDGAPGKARLSDAFQDLIEALESCHPRRSPRVFYSALHNLALVLLEGAHRVEDLDAALRRLNEAQKLLRRHRIRRRSVTDAKLRWIRALILARFGSTQRAEQLLIDARRDLMELGVVVDVFLISFDLADLYLVEDRWGTLRMLAEEVMKLEAPEGSHEVLAALLLWQRAIVEQRLTGEIIHFARRRIGYHEGLQPSSSKVQA